MLLRSHSILRQRLYLHKCGHFHSSSASWRKVIQKFKLADIGEGITECEIIKWSVKPSSAVASFDPLCEVQSDKASVEITSPFDGIVKEILVQEGQVAKVGEGLCLIEVDEEDASTSPDVEPVDAPSSTVSPQEAPPPAKEPGNTREEPLPEAPRRRPHPLDPNAKQQETVSTNDANVLATPSVRHFARSQGVDLAKLVPGSGKDGRIERKDVEAWLSGSKKTSAEEPEPTQAGEDAVVELGRTRYGMWKAMTKSLEVPHFGYTTSLDITSLHALLPTLNAHIPAHYLPPSSSPATPVPPQAVSPSSLYPAPSPPDVPEGARYKRLTYLPTLLKTLSNAMMEWPLFRSSLTPSSVSSPGEKAPKPTLTIRPQTDISLALSTPTGLYTPTVSRVSSHSIYALASHLAYLSSLGRQVPCGLTVKEMPKRGGTISVSNIGAIGAGESAFPRLVEGGGVAIVVLGRAQWVWDVSKDDKGERRLKLPVSWSADHRIVEGAELAAFVECWRGYVENPGRLIAEGV